jgi:hypothetical protein
LGTENDVCFPRFLVIDVWAASTGQGLMPVLSCIVLTVKPNLARVWKSDKIGIIPDVRIKRNCESQTQTSRLPKMPKPSPQMNLLSIVRERQIRPEDRTVSMGLIYQHMLTNSRSIRGGNFDELSNSDLGLLFQVTHEQFFDGQVGQLCEQKASRPLSFRLSTRMTTSGGMTTMNQYVNRRSRATEFEIAIATTPLFGTFNEESTAIVSGVKCNDRLEALQRIMEHEMVHLIEMLLWNDSNCSANPFKKIVRRFFGHTESNHQLLTPRDLARKRLGISPGDQVTFSVDGQQIKGHVNRITKRATILVKHPQGVLYSDGCKYQKFYVPLKHLRRA